MAGKILRGQTRGKGNYLSVIVCGIFKSKRGSCVFLERSNAKNCVQVTVLWEFLWYFGTLRRSLSRIYQFSDLPEILMPFLITSIFENSVNFRAEHLAKFYIIQKMDHLGAPNPYGFIFVLLGCSLLAFWLLLIPRKPRLHIPRIGKSPHHGIFALATARADFLVNGRRLAEEGYRKVS
jgi:hypothetical protein